MLLALAFSAQLFTAMQSDDAAAQVQHLNGEPTAQPRTPSPESGGATLTAGPTTRRKSTSFLLAGAQFGVGAIAGYLALVLGVAANFPRGGLSSPVDSNDILLLMVLPAAATAAFGWLVGLFDGAQRGIFSSALWALLGAAGGELLGVGAGSLIGRSAYPNDSGLAGIVMVFAAPALSALTATLFMELFKPGEEVAPYVSLSVARGYNGAGVFGPALGLRF
jgi:hypothetical protein